jgi:nucleotide-binding universal stress UspA family protein
MPTRIERILCPLNLRHFAMSDRAWEMAVHEAHGFGADLIAVTVAPEMERNLNIRDSRAFWGGKLKAYLDENPPGAVPVHADVLIGAPHRQIVRYATEKRIDLIVMQAANPRIRDYLLGTTASHVVTHAPCSVFVVR